MRSNLVLKEKNESKIVYLYSCDDSIDIVDGEIEYNIRTEELKTIKPATNDEHGSFAEWLYPHILNTIFSKGTPPKIKIATG